ncbi:MAG: LysE family translocator [Betaproteobacteria bacterium]|jgi:threonine/homoserine/homoserine lactone efflux protein|uniref:LysE family translocator n=1 Tax=Thiomonas arsenitoxydans (strain DSM 22701 / CIP 110005 / 3As) TaxID=426114 RepID=A0A8I1MV35_THIA3|nr:MULTISPECIES: LysE family translocator [Thiomonas]MBN8743395.1 LysE family translocator [Thiomonas arsenitoxydans]MDE2176232.1 LysE family translocator [Betaproteobacteria bacterium]ODU98466.1 MAG: lysine transporter LysE [Thiomonas sp. SCN 64-16]
MGPEFLITSLLVVASPGTGVLLTLAAGLSHGARGAVVAAFGCTLGILPQMLLAVTGLATVLHTSSLAFQLLKITGVCYLLYLAWMTWRDRGALTINVDAPARSDLQVIRHAVLVNLLNPKLSMFFVAFLPQFVRSGEAKPTGTMLELSAAFMAMTFVVFVLYGTFAAKARVHILSRPAVLLWMRRGFATAFIGLGLKLALVHR